MLFHHIVLDEWSLNLLMDQLGHAYRRRAAGLAPEWPDQPPGFHRFATAQRAAQADRAHLDHWLDHLRGAPRARPILGDAPGGRDPQGGWTRIDLPAEIARGLYATARRNTASLFATAYAAIGAALGRLGGIGDLVIGTSASGRNDPAWFDTVGYFTTMTAHRLALGAQDTPAALIAQVRDRIARSLPHSEIPLDQVAEALTGHPVTRLDEMFEVFIQIHARNRMNGAIALMDGSRVEYRQIDPDKAETLLGLQFEIVEDVAGETVGLRIMMSHRADHYGPAEIRQITAAVQAMLARFAQPQDDQPLGTGPVARPAPRRHGPRGIV
ncbi:Condensation domain-containing protein [Paracoccus pantotrophus]|nr:Condensation domain-containing protein [Paracoccus pantotrophus]